MERAISRGVNFRTRTEADVVGLFTSGLSAFITPTGGQIRSRSVTLRQERSFPSDQDFAILFTNASEFRLHLFGLQFKRWNGDGWSIDTRQLQDLRRLGHVIAYALPRPCILTASSSLHGFYFINPKCVHSKATQLLIADDIETAETDTWGHKQVVSAVPNDKTDYWAPHFSWGEFFSAIEEGSVRVAIPGGPANPPNPGDEPDPKCFSPGAGIGLTLSANGRWGVPWAQRSVADHVRYWSEHVLTPPAAVVAYESYTQTIDLIEIGGGA